MNLLITIQPTFSNRLNSQEYQIEMEYGDLPRPVQFEVLKYFKSPEFISEQVQDYVLHHLSASSDSCYITQPIYNGLVQSVEFKVIGKILSVYLTVKLYSVPVNAVININSNHGHQLMPNQTMICTAPLTDSALLEQLEEGFYKASHSGPLIGHWGSYLGEQPRYMIYIDRVKLVQRR